MNEYAEKHDTSGELSCSSILGRCPLASCDCKDDRKSQESSSWEHLCSVQHQKAIVKTMQCLLHSKRNRDLQANSNSTHFSEEHARSYGEKLSTSLDGMEIVKSNLVRLSSGASQLRRRRSTLAESVNETKASMSLHRANIGAMSINTEIMVHDIVTTGHRIDCARRLPNGSMPGDLMVWKVSSVREKMHDAQSERQRSIFSPAFYTAAAGYKLCLRLYLNGDATALGTHISIFLVILRGDYDILLQWPFPYRVSFCLVDQRALIKAEDPTQAKHAIGSFRPDPSSASFQRPFTSMNIASGVPKLISLTEFNQPAETNRYCIDDTIFIKVFIDFLGLPKSMIPFVLTMDLALPTFIRAKLIAEEKKKYHEQNSDDA